MRKKRPENERQLLLQRELQLLRKGTGLTKWKLQEAPELLRIIAGRLEVNMEALSLDQAYAYLLYELSELDETEMMQALRNAYSIGLDGAPAGLTRRRLDFALQMHRHPDTVKAYENRAIQQLAHLLVAPVRLPAPRIAATAMRSEVVDSDDRAIKALQRSVSEGLAGLYELGTHGPEILKAFGRHKKPYLDANITCSLLPSKRGKDWYTYDYRYTFHASKNIFRVGIVTSSQNSGILMKSGFVDEVTELCADADFELEMPNILSDWRFIAHNIQEGTQQPYWFTELDVNDRRELLDSVWQLDSDDCRIIEIKLPPKISNTEMLYEVHALTNLRVNERYAYWEAPGLMYVNTVTVDVSRFPERERWKFFIKPFLGTAFQGKLEASGDRYTLPASTWLMLGHGICISWQEA